MLPNLIYQLIYITILLQKKSNQSLNKNNPNRRPPFGGQQNNEYGDLRINEDIRVPEVRLTGENVENGIYPTSKALRMAEELGLDLVEIAANANPPVCRIVDVSKYLYEKKRREKEVKANAQKSVLKEIRFTSETDDHDIDFKAKHAERFLTEGAKVKALVMFKGRSIVFKERGELLLLKFAQKLEEFGSLEQMPRLEGKRMFVYIVPKKKK